MQVVHLVNSHESTIIGEERHVLNLAVAQKAHGLGAVIITDCSGPFTRACDQQSIPVIMVPELKKEMGGPTRPDEAKIQVLMAQFRSLRADLIHCHTHTAAWQAIPAGNRLQLPCIFTLHFAIEQGWKDVRRTTGLKFTVITVSRAMFEKLKSDGWTEPDLYFVPHGTPVASPVSRPELPQPHRPGLMLVCTLSWLKGVHIAVLMMAELRRRLGPDCPSLDIYGEGDEKAILQEMTTVLELDNIVRFHGMQPGILEHCASGNVLLVSSHQETGPIVVLEAMSRGMPIVTTDVGQVREMLPDHRYGRIAPVGSIMALADAAESLLSDITDGNFDPGLLIERHRSCYTSEKMAERIEAIYRQMLRRPAGTASAPVSARP